MDYKRLVPFIAVLLISAISMYLSDIEARLNTDTHHWGIIFSNAAEITRGGTPYRDTYEIYGILSSLINAVVFQVAEPTLVILGRTAAFFYALNLILSYVIARRFLGQWYALFVPLFMFLLHPYVVYPWPNYPSYSFILAALYFLLRDTSWSFFVAGILFGLSVLTRQSMVLTIVPIMLVILSMKIWQQRTGGNLGNRVFQLFLGVSLPIAIFLLFLLLSDLEQDWYKLTFTVSSRFVQLWEGKLGHNSTTDFILPLLKTIYLSTTSMRAIFLSLMAWSATAYAIVKTFAAIRRGRPQDDEIAYILIACAALFGFAQGAHTMDIFRWVNASTLGIIFLVLATQTLGRSLFRENDHAAVALLVVSACAMSTNLLSNPELRGRNLVKEGIWTKEVSKRLSSPYRGRVRLLHGKAWPKYQTKSAEDLESALRRGERCGLSVIVNTTTNPLLPYIVRGIKKAQREPCRVPRRLSDQIFVDEVRTRKDLLSRGNAILAAGPQTPVPDHYRVLLKKDARITIAIPASCLSMSDDHAQ